MSLHKRPDPPHVGIIRRTVKKHHRGPEDERAEHLPWSHHPSHVGYPAQNIGLLDIHAMRYVLRALYGKAAVRMDRCLGPSRGAARVEEHKNVFRICLFRFGDMRLSLHDLVPEHVSFSKGDLLPDVAMNDRLSDGGDIL